MKHPLPLEPKLREAHETALSPRLKGWKERGPFPSALLITGPAGIGKRAIGFFLAQTLTCENAGWVQSDQDSLFGGSGPSETTEVACGRCAACQKAQSGHWVDVREIVSDKPGHSIKIDQVRELQAEQGFGAIEGGYRVFLIPDAHRLTLQAANSLLKLLEEPPPGWVFILTASDLTLIPKTVLSRCQQLPLRPLPEETVAALLIQDGVAPERAKLCARVAQGSLSRAAQLAQDEFWEKRALVWRFLQKPGAEHAALLDGCAGSTEQAHWLLDQLESITSDLAIATAGGAPSGWINRDGEKTLSDLLRTQPHPSAWVERSQRISRARAELATPVNLKLLLSDVLGQWMGP